MARGDPLCNRVVKMKMGSTNLFVVDPMLVFLFRTQAEFYPLEVLTRRIVMTFVNSAAMAGTNSSGSTYCH